MSAPAVIIAQPNKPYLLGIVPIKAEALAKVLCRFVFSLHCDEVLYVLIDNCTAQQIAIRWSFQALPIFQEEFYQLVNSLLHIRTPGDLIHCPAFTPINGIEVLGEWIGAITKWTNNVE